LARATRSERRTPLLPDMIDIPGGIFLMGSDCRRKDEAPAHRVAVRNFRVARLPVTNREFAAYLALTGTAPPLFWDDPRFSSPEQPVVGVPWQGAVEYCRWLSSQSTGTFRLPTEAEWEYTALARRQTALYPWGDEIPEASPGVSLATRAMDRPAPAGSGPVNPWGVRDMGWNIHEWCSDWYEPGYYAVAPSFDPRGPEEGSRKASRGGAWRHQAKISRCGARSAIPPQFQYNDYGFRVFAEAG
jgi:sulfatase modifying factor 1